MTSGFRGRLTCPETVCTTGAHPSDARGRRSLLGGDPPKPIGAGAVLAGANPKNLLLAVGAAAAIAEIAIPGGEQAVAYAVFALIGTIGVGAPVVI
jgi:hypothetical protein